MDNAATEEDKKRVELLLNVRENGLGNFDLQQLETLRTLLEKKDYSHSKKAQKSKSKLLGKINAKIYEKEEFSQ